MPVTNMHTTADRPRAAIVILARNSDADELAETLRVFEQRFNHRFHYPYIMLNDRPFDADFIDKIEHVVMAGYGAHAERRNSERTAESSSETTGRTDDSSNDSTSKSFTPSTNIPPPRILYGKVPAEQWTYPEWINQTRAAESRNLMKDIAYGTSESYRFMCRYQSGYSRAWSRMKAVALLCNTAIHVAPHPSSL